MKKRACPNLARVDLHFHGGLPASDEHALQQHWPTCSECRARYQRQRLLAELDPALPRWKVRIGTPLGLWRARPRTGRVLAAATLAAAALTGLALVRRASPDQAGFAPRGAPADAASFLVYRGAPGQPRTLVEDTIRARDELSFRVKTPPGAEYLLIFATDANRNVYWYYPAWNDAADDPAAAPVRASADFVTLGEGIVHPLVPGPLDIHVVFTRNAVHVREVEAHLSTLNELSPGAVEQRLRVEVVP